MGRFVPRPSAEEIIAGTVGAGTAGSGYNAVFHYPEGGIGGLADRMHAGLMGLVRMNTQVKRVNWKDKIVITDKGEYGYDKLINTSPLGEFVSDILEPADSKLVENAGKLRHTAVLFFSAGWKGGEGAGLPEGCHWIYFPEERFRFYRVGFQSNVSKKTVPEGFSSCYIEISYPPGKLPEKDRIAGIGEEAIAQLKQEKIIPPSAQMDHILPGYMDPAYVLYDSNWSKARSHILGSLKKKGILSGGRYGGWEYSAMEEAVKWGWELAEQCLSG
ncbi:MAG: hypothetical protein JXJ19_03465 [Elusimicrobia bacterium]|nr:hypothetical protein [Elusimicrobiota bacterium]